ncbi:hypothetical protein S83_027426 [Arachis hypogaea]|nr:DUF247 domain protein [Arachis hypogaea]
MLKFINPLRLLLHSVHSTMDPMKEDDSVFTDWGRGLCEILENLEKRLTGEDNRVSRPKIQIIPKYMAEKVEFQRYYKPQFISLTVFHTGETEREWYKGAWASMYVRETNLKVEDVYREMYDWNIREGAVLKPMWTKLYDVDPFDEQVDIGLKKRYGPIVDGCCVLQLLQKSESSVDPEQELKISLDKLGWERPLTPFFARHGPSSPCLQPLLALFLHLSRHGLLSTLKLHKSKHVLFCVLDDE